MQRSNPASFNLLISISYNEKGNEMITTEMIGKFHEKCAEDAAVYTLGAAMAKTEMKDLAFVPMNAAKLSGEFSVEVTTHGITAQQRSGRCWMFAMMNILREEAAKNLGMEKFTLSGNYLAFYDKLEKANNVLEMAIEYADRPMNDRMMEYVLEGFGDGGYWDMAVDLVKKYGVVPESVMPDSYQSCHTETFRKMFMTLVRKDALELRRLVLEGIDPQERREEMLAELYRVESIAFGLPVESFDFSWRDKDGKFHEEYGITPKQFYEKYIGLDLGQYITITNHPTDALPMDHYYQFHYIGSMAESNIVNLNLTQQELEDLWIAQLKDGEAVWFGCDSGAFGDRAKGVWDPDSLNYEGILGGVDLSMTKKDRLMSHDSFATHAMILVGVNFDQDGTPNRWKIENSWGEDVGKKGYFVCSEKYFREFVYEAIINKKHLSAEQLAMLDKQPVTINPWESDWS